VTTPSLTLSSFLHAEALGRLVEQGVPGGRRRIADLDAADLNAQAAPGRALGRRERGVALDHLDRAKWHVELLGGHLRERGAHAGAEIDLAAIERALALGVDGEERIDLGERQRFSRGGRALREYGIELAGEREADDQRAAALEDVAAGRNEMFHGFLPLTHSSTRA
jgi:hypothetical protein